MSEIEQQLAEAIRLLTALLKREPFDQLSYEFPNFICEYCEAAAQAEAIQHAPDCPYIVAQKFVEAGLKTKPTIIGAPPQPILTEADRQRLHIAGELREYRHPIPNPEKWEPG